MPTPSHSTNVSHLASAGLLFAVWTAATWVLEGRIETLLRPDAVLDRLVYALVANLLIGVVGAVFAVRWLQRGGAFARADAGFAAPARIATSVIAGALLGFGLYVAQGAPTLDPIVLTNAYAQVLVVSAAEVLVCWAVVGATVEAALRDYGRRTATIAAAITASAAFGIYHFAHSPPFNTLAMVALLTAVGLVTSVFYFVSREVYGTIVFHNFLGTFGVAQALQASGKLDTFAVLQTPLLAMAVVTVAALIAADRLWLRGAAAAR